MRVGAAALVMTACVSTMAQSPENAAVLAVNDAAARATLSAAVSEMLRGASVTLAADALLHDSHLTVERARRRAADGQLLNGRILERPEQFQLIKEMDQCILVQQSSGRRKLLSSIGCRAL
jgi:hypothetical protein